MGVEASRLCKRLAVLPALVAIACQCGEPTCDAPPATRVFAEPRDDIPGLKNFAKVSDILYRGEQPSAEGFAELKKMGIKTVVNLRSFNSDRDEMKGQGLQYAHIYCKAWHPEDEDVLKFLQVMNDPKNHPVFVHCQHGADRTGMMCAIYRIVHEGWSNADAAKELHNFGFHVLWTDIVEYLEEFEHEAMVGELKTAKPFEIRVIE